MEKIFSNFLNSSINYLNNFNYEGIRADLKVDAKKIIEKNIIDLKSILDNIGFNDIDKLINNYNNIAIFLNEELNNIFKFSSSEISSLIYIMDDIDESQFYQKKIFLEIFSKYEIINKNLEISNLITALENITKNYYMELSNFIKLKIVIKTLIDALEESIKEFKIFEDKIYSLSEINDNARNHVYEVNEFFKFAISEIRELKNFYDVNIFITNYNMILKK